MWHTKEPSLLNGHECRALVKICSSSPVMVTSLYEWKMLERDDKPQTNKQTLSRMTKCRYLPSPSIKLSSFICFDWYFLQCKLDHCKNDVYMNIDTFKQWQWIILTCRYGHRLMYLTSILKQTHFKSTLLISNGYRDYSYNIVEYFSLIFTSEKRSRFDPPSGQT